MSTSSKYGSKYVSEQKYQTLTKSQRRNLKRSRKRREKKECKMIETIEETLDISSILLNYGLKPFDVGGEGDCFYRALADQINGDPATHLDFRKRIISWLKENCLQILPWFNNDEKKFNRYLKRISKPGIWCGGEFEIMAAAILYNVNIVLISIVDGSERKTIISGGDDIKNTIYLVHIIDEHFQSTRKI